MAEQWEYMSFNCWLDTNPGSGRLWRHNLEDVPYSPVMTDIFNHFGSQGWELVNFVPISGTIFDKAVTESSLSRSFAAFSYCAVFKRRKP